MKKKILFLLLLSFFLQLSFLPFIFPKFNINLLLIFALLLVLLSGKSLAWNLPWLIFCGFLFDVFSTLSFGAGTFSFFVIGLITSLYQKIISSGKDNFFSGPFLFLIAKLIFDFFLFFINKVYTLFNIGNFSQRDFLLADYLIEMGIFVLLATIFWMFLLKRKVIQKNEVKLF